MVASNPRNVPNRQRRQLLRNSVVVGIVVIATLSVILWRIPATQLHEIKSSSAVSATYVGAENCDTCHAQEAETWRQSHHAQAMQPASASTVLGNFRDAR